MADQPLATLTHWRAFSASDWQHVRAGVVGLALGSIVPVALFYAAFRVWGFSTAVVLVLAWSAGVFAWHFRQTRAADVFSATTFAFACTKAAAGLLSQNTTLYLAWPSLENLIYGTAFLGSAALGQPLLALYARRLYPISDEVNQSRPFKRAFMVASGAWFCGHALRAVMRLWLLATLPLELYLVADTVAGWPINITLVAFTTWFPLRQLRQAGLIGAVEPAPGSV